MPKSKFQQRNAKRRKDRKDKQAKKRRDDRRDDRRDRSRKMFKGKLGGRGTNTRGATEDPSVGNARLLPFFILLFFGSFIRLAGCMLFTVSNLHGGYPIALFPVLISVIIQFVGLFLCFAEKMYKFAIVALILELIIQSLIVLNVLYLDVEPVFLALVLIGIVLEICITIFICKQKAFYDNEQSDSESSEDEIDQENSQKDA